MTQSAPNLSYIYLFENVHLGDDLKAGKYLEITGVPSQEIVERNFSMPTGHLFKRSGQRQNRHDEWPITGTTSISFNGIITKSDIA